MKRSNRKILFVSLFPPKSGGLALQSRILVDCLVHEGLHVKELNVHISIGANRRFGKICKVLVQPLSLLIQLLTTVGNVDHIHVAACSFWGFMPFVVSLPIAKIL